MLVAIPFVSVLVASIADAFSNEMEQLATSVKDKTITNVPGLRSNGHREQIDKIERELPTTIELAVASIEQEQMGALDAGGVLSRAPQIEKALSLFFYAQDRYASDEGKDQAIEALLYFIDPNDAVPGSFSDDFSAIDRAWSSAGHLVRREHLEQARKWLEGRFGSGVEFRTEIRLVNGSLIEVLFSNTEDRGLEIYVPDAESFSQVLRVPMEIAGQMKGIVSDIDGKADTADEAIRLIDAEITRRMP
jgi:uncharacterized membrane protein YkvA (DUF1232 family)